MQTVRGSTVCADGPRLTWRQRAGHLAIVSVRVAFPLATVASCTRSFSTSFTGRAGIPTSTELDFAHLLLAHGGPVIGDGGALVAGIVDGGGGAGFGVAHGPSGG